MANWANAAHCGDALWSLSYLRRLPGDHVFYVRPDFVEAFAILAADSRVRLDSVDHLPEDAQDMWIANGRHEGSGVQWRCQEDIIGYVRDYHNAFGKAWETREDMLFDWQWLRPLKWRDAILILNTPPLSGQCPEYSQEELDQLARDLTFDGHRVVMVNGTPHEHAYSLLQIACLSASAKMIIGGASGPFFVTMNTAAKDCHRIVLLDPMKLDYGPTVEPIRTVSNVSGVRAVLREMNFFRYL